MTFDIIITTYNRPNEILRLVNGVKQCTLKPELIVVVDSSDDENAILRNRAGVNYVRSNHKNQPYQRYLGYLHTNSEFVVFFDDDVTITNKSIFNILLSSFIDPDIVGSNVKFYQEGEITVNREKAGKQINKSNLFIYAFMTFTGAPSIKAGKSWFAGLKGIDDNTIKTTESFGGPGSMCFRRDIVPHLFDSILFSLFEQKMAMGEDKYISMGALKFGKIAYNDIVCMTHPANVSSYFDNMFTFMRKKMYSRLWLSLRYAEVKRIPVFFAFLHYYWYALWRIIFSVFDVLLGFKSISLKRLKGKLSNLN